MSLSILHETTDWLVLNKPPFLHTVNLKSSVDSLESALLAERPNQSELSEAGIVHRLDFETSGCVLAAKNLASFERLKKDVRSNDIQKLYWAIVSQRPSVHEFSLYFSSRYRGSKKVTVKERGKPSERGQCRLKVINESDSQLLLEVELQGPGQRHQIRAGLSFFGSPLLGDSLYGGTNWKGGIGLHARALKLADALVTAEIPESWKSLRLS